MRLIAIEIEGFKSFATRTNLSFGTGITGIVGPNGSGKSNVAEAIRWVLGEQSMKALRGKDRTDIIYSGSNKQSRRARVSLMFDNQDFRFPLRANEITIARTLTQDGISQYTVNNEVVRLIDLRQMLAESGIGAKSYTVISQGTVDQYLNATPEGRKELFNEATGIKSLQIKIGQAEQNMKKTESHAQEVRSLLAEITPRLTLLQRQIDRYEERERYVALFQEKQLLFYHAAWQKGSQTTISLQQQYAQVQKRIALTQKNRAGLEERAFQATSTDRSSIETLQTELVYATQAYDTAKQLHEHTKKQREELETSIAQIQQEKAQANKEYEDTKHAPAQQYDLKTLLQSCKAHLEQILQKNTPPEDATKKLITSITHILSFTDQVLPAKSPQVMFAKLSAIEEERMKQLASLPDTQEPSKEKIIEITNAIAHATSMQKPQEHEVTMADIEHARQEELAAEREGATLESSLAQIARETHSLKEEILRECGSEVFQRISTEGDGVSNPPTEDELRKLAAKIAAIGQRDQLVIQEYQEAKARHDAMTEQLEDVEEAMKTIQTSIEELSHQMQENFARQFSYIQEQFSHYFTQLFGGGSAKLLATPEGVDIAVIPPQKKARHIGLLSGGEKALTSIALLLAVLDAQKPPFIVLDEVDAALDEANSHRFALLLKSQSAATQRIIISHNRETMSQADLLYGVTMHSDGISTVYSIKIADYATTGAEIQT